MRYTFGDTATAEERLKMISTVFNPFSKEFIVQNVKCRIHSVIDLGCGPGFSTEMLAGSTGAETVTGIDISDHFLASARERLRNHAFIQCDITRDFPPVNADLIYMRFFLSHLKNIRLLVNDWIKHLNPGGLMIIDETEDIFTVNPFFSEYLNINKGLINAQGAELFVGQLIDKELEGLNVFVNRSTLHPVTNDKAALMFYPNTVSVWEKEEWIKTNISPIKIKEISDELYKLGKNGSPRSDISWKMKRIILKQA